MTKFLTILFFLCSFSESLSLEIIPFIRTLVQDEESAFQYYIHNKTDSILAFEIVVFRRKQDEKGDDILEKDEDSFYVFPSQIIIPPHTQRTVKVRWLGKKFDQEQAFRVSFDQFQVNFDKKKEKGVSVTVNLRVLASLYITPKEAKEKIELVSHNGSYVVVRNVGTKRGSVNNSSILINNRKLSEIIKDKTSRVILPGAVRKFEIIN